MDGWLESTKRTHWGQEVQMGPGLEFSRLWGPVLWSEDPCGSLSGRIIYFYYIHVLVTQWLNVELFSRPWDPGTRSDQGLWSDLGTHCSGGPDLWPETQHSGAAGRLFWISIRLSCLLTERWSDLTFHFFIKRVFICLCFLYVFF